MFLDHLLQAIAEHLARLRVAVLTSDAEGSSNALLEYMAAGRPIVATSVGGNSELVQHERTGLLVPPDRDDQLAEAIERLMADEALSAQLADNARHRAAQKGLDQVGRRHEQLYQDLLSGVLPEQGRLASEGRSHPTVG